MAPHRIDSDRAHVTAASRVLFLASGAFALLDGGLRGPATASPGGTITINVGHNVRSIEVSDPTTGTTTDHDVQPGKDTAIAMPNVPGGTVVRIRAGKGVNADILLVETVAPGP